MNLNHAFAYGALVKMAEYQVDPAAFVQAAIQTQDPQSLKISRAILEYEKVAGFATSAGKGIDRGADFLKNLTAGRAGRAGSKNLINTVEDVMGGNVGRMDEHAQGMLRGAQQRVGDQNLAMGGAAALGLGGAGAAAGMQPEDTWANKARGALGMDQTSHFGGMMNNLTG